jgi:nicotinamide mononucleotide transporter
MIAMRGSLYGPQIQRTKGTTKMEPQHEPKKQSLKERLKALWNYFSTYEKIWFFSILILASVFAVLFPEEDVNGVNGGLIMALYLADTFLNILCELLISKQSKWNFIVSVFVEITEILICVVLAYRFATMATTLFFWLPIDIISFINWHKHPDHQETSLTKVRKLSGWAEVAVLAGVVLWTVGVGYFLTTLDFGTDLFHGNETLEVIVCYLDACASAVGVCNGVFILLRIREQWIAWYISALLEAAINILSGQYVLLVLKVGYLTNTTYGYIKWSEYIRKHKDESALDTKLF